MRRVVEHFFCDLCGAEQDRDGLTEHTFVWDKVTYVIEPCDPCDEALEATPIGELVRHALKVKRTYKPRVANRPEAAPVGDETVCALCGNEFTTPRGLGQHLQKSHPAEYARRRG